MNFSRLVLCGNLLILYIYSGDNIKLEPMSGEIKANSHQNIKLTLISSRYPTHFEGEIQCQIDWDITDDLNK